MELDSKDRAILAELDFGARKSDAAIGRAVSLSKQNVRYRIQRMKNKKIITGFYPVIGSNLQGLSYCRLFLKFQNLTPKVKKDIINHFMESNSFQWVADLDIAYDFVVAMWAKSLKEFKDEVNQFLFRYGSFVQEKDESIGINITNLATRAVTNGKQVELIVGAEATKRPVQLDIPDTKLLTSLSQDARMPLVEIAERMGVSPATANYRIKKLQKEGVLKAFRVAIDYNKVGLTHFKLFLYLKDFSEKDLKKLQSYLKNEPSVNYIVEEMGVCDLDFEVLLPSYSELLGFMDKLRMNFPTIIRDYKVTILTNTLKIGYFPPTST